MTHQIDKELINRACMMARLEKGLDPLTGEKLVAKGKIGFVNGVCCDETGKEVTLSEKGTWIYKA